MIYFIASATVLVLLALLCCIIGSYKNKTDASLALGKYEIAVFLSIIFCILIYIMPSETMAKLMFGLYCFFMAYSLYALALYVYSFDSSGENEVLRRVSRHSYIVFMIIDGIILVASAFTKLCFTVTPYVLKNGFSTWMLTFNDAITFHMGLCYFISIFLFIKLIDLIIHSNSFYKSKLVLVLYLFSIAFITNLIFTFFSHFWIYDFTPIVYGILVIVCYTINIYSAPKILKKRIINVASETVSDAIICFDYNGNCFFTNETAKRFYNSDNYDWVTSFIQGDQDYSLKTIILKIDGEVHTCKVEYHRFYDKKNKVLGSYIKLNDYTKEMKRIEMEEYRATHDTLTGLYNREYFFKEAQKILSLNPEVPRVLVCSDIKNFKLFNELFGMKHGDKILKTQAEMFKRAAYDDVVLGRISGDKFAMLIKERNFKPDLALENTNQIMKITKEFDFPLTVYLGVYLIKDNNENVRSMYDKAYMAIKNITEGNNTRLVYYEPVLMDKLMEEKNIVSRFDSALKDNQFTFYLQSQINPETEQCVGAEALVRWNFPGKGILNPGDYIKILENSGQIYKLDRYIWEEVAKLLKNWKERGIEKYISVNISIKDFYYLDIYKEFTQLVEKYEISPSMLNLEITESVLSGNNNSYKEVLVKLQEYGFKIEMDDFGSGYSSLNILQSVSMNVLKIDMGFIKETENIEKAQLIISSIAKMAKALGMSIIAEGVENKKQMNFLKKIEVDLLQGYLYSKPVPVEDFEKLYLGGKK